MGVVAVRTSAEGWSGGASSQSNQLLAEVVRRVYEVRKFVYVDSPIDGPEVILSHPDVPKVGDSYAWGNDADETATCISVDPRRTKSPLVFEVTAKYDSDRLAAAVTNNPLLQPPLIRWSFRPYSRPFTRAIDNATAVLNSAGLPYDPPLEYIDTHPFLEITRNKATFSAANALAYQNALNAEPFAGAAPPGSTHLELLTG